MLTPKTIETEGEFCKRITVETGRGKSVGYITQRKHGNHAQRQPQLNVSTYFAVNQIDYANWQAAIHLMMAQFAILSEAWEQAHK